MDKKTPSKKKPAKKNTTRSKSTTRKTKSATSRSRRSAKPKVEKTEAKPVVKTKKTTTKKVVAKKEEPKRKSTTRSSSRKRKTTARSTEKTKPVVQKRVIQVIKSKPVVQKKTVQKTLTPKREVTTQKIVAVHTPKSIDNTKPNTPTTHKSNPNSNNRNNNTSTSFKKPTNTEYTVTINQNVAILIDGNNIEKSIHSLLNTKNAMLDFDNIIPKLLRNRGLNRLIYFREGLHISSKLADRLHKNYFGTVVPCHKSADIPLSITATQLAEKVDTIIILSGDSDYVDLVRHLRSRGVRVEIAAIKQTTAKILIDEADFFTEITKKDCYVR